MRSGGGAVPAGACGVWLDTAELKRGRARPLSAKPRAPGGNPAGNPGPVLLPRPRTRQSFIPSFFGRRADERDKENSRPTPCTPKKDSEDSGVPLAAGLVKILALPQLRGAWDEPPGAEQGAQGTSRAWRTPMEPLELQVEPRSQSRASRGAGANSWCCSFSQGSEHSGTHRSKPRLFPGETASGSRKAQPWGRVNCGTGFAGTENTNPVPGAAPRSGCRSPRSLVRAQPLRERGQSPGRSCRQLCPQDSQGNRGSSPRPGQPRGPCSEALFTQDSEGNRVIKHC